MSWPYSYIVNYTETQFKCPKCKKKVLKHEIHLHCIYISKGVNYCTACGRKFLKDHIKETNNPYSKKILLKLMLEVL